MPIPPSKAIGHAEYDDRLIRTLTTAFDGYNVDIRLLLRQKASAEGDHAGNRLAPDELMQLLEVDHAIFKTRALRQTIILFDDVLTSGKHFKCCERRLREVAPITTPIVGMFIARRVLPAATAEEFDDLP